MFWNEAIHASMFSVSCIHAQGNKQKLLVPAQRQLQSNRFTSTSGVIDYVLRISGKFNFNLSIYLL